MHRILFTGWLIFIGGFVQAQSEEALYEKISTLFKTKDKQLFIITDSVYQMQAHSDLSAYALTLSGNFMRRYDRDSAAQIFEKLEEALPTVNTDSIALMATKSLAIYHDLQNDSDKAKEYYSKALKMAFKNTSELLDIYYNLSYYFSERGQLDSAIVYVTKGINLAASEGFNKRETEFKIVLSSQLYYQGDTLVALKRAEDALKRAEELNDSSLILRAHRNIVTKLDKKSAKKALYHTQQAINTALALNKTRNLGYDFLALGDIQNDIVSETEAEKSYRKALKYFQTSSQIRNEIITYSRLLPILIAPDNVQEVRTVMSKIKNALNRYSFTLYEQSNMYQELRDASLDLKDYEQALTYAYKLDSIRKEQFNSEKNKAVEEIIAKYETKEKEARIKDLQVTNENQQLKLSRQGLLIGFVIFLALAFLIISYLIYQQRLLKRTKETNELKQRLLRLQLNPHFLFNSLNAIQHMVYKNKDTQKTADYLARFSHLTRQILELNQRDLISLEEEITFITNYLSIQQIRFDQPFYFKIEVAESVDQHNTFIPPMISQPFLENAIEHGILDKDGEGIIKVQITSTKNNLLVLIEDNGDGRDAASFKKNNKKHRSMATNITRDRLLEYERETGDRVSMDIEDVMEGGLVVGTRVLFILPLKIDE